MAGRCNTHWAGVWVLANGLFVHGEEVGVTLADGVLAEALGGVAEVQVCSVVQRSNTETSVDLLGDRTGSNVTWDEVTECWVAALQEVVALILRDGVWIAVIVRFLRGPDAAVVTQRLGHQNGLGLPGGVHRQAGWVELDERWGREVCAGFVCTHDGRGVGVLGQGGHVVHVAVATGCQDNGMAGVCGELAGDQVAHDQAFAALFTITFGDNDVNHFVMGEDLYGAEVDLAL